MARLRQVRYEKRRIDDIAAASHQVGVVLGGAIEARRLRPLLQLGGEGGADLHHDQAPAARAERIEKLAPALTPTVEINRSKAELARRKQSLEAAYERWQTGSAELTRLLRLDPAAVVEPIEEPHLRVDVIDLLLAHGADVEADGPLGTGPRALAEGVRGRSLPAVKRLIEAGAQVNPQGAAHAYQPLCTAQADSQPDTQAEIIAFLTAQGAECTP